MTKVLYVSLCYGDVRNTWAGDAFRDLGCEFEQFDQFSVFDEVKGNYNEVRKRLIDRCKLFVPDLLLLQIQHTKIINGPTIAHIRKLLPRCKIVNYTIDVRNYVPETYREVAEHSDYNLISSTGQLKFFEEKLGKPVRYWQIGYNPKLYYPNPQKYNTFEYDVSFIANNNTVENYPGRDQRENVCKLLRKAFGNRFALYGHGWPSDLGSRGSVPQPNVLQVYHNSFCVISVSHYNDLSHYFSDRLLMCLASGRPTISLKFPQWESYFADRSDIVIADSVDDIVGKVKYLLAHRDLAESIGESGANKVFSEHSYMSRCLELLEMVGLK